MDNLPNVCNKATTLADFLKAVTDLGHVAIGSRAWGGATSLSDYDYVLGVADVESLTQLARDAGRSVSPSLYYVSSYYVQFDDGVVNLVTACQADLEAWRAASAMMAHAPTSVRHDRDSRQLVFEALLAMLKKLPTR